MMWYPSLSSSPLTGAPSPRSREAEVGSRATEEGGGREKKGRGGSTKAERGTYVCELLTCQLRKYSEAEEVFGSQDNS